MYLKYEDIMKEYLRNGKVEQADTLLSKKVKAEYLMLHHAVIRVQKDSMKVSIASGFQRLRKKSLLNDCLESGPLNSDFLKIIQTRVSCRYSARI